MKPEPSSDFDSPWKEAIERFLEQFLAFFFPHVVAAIDWSRGYQSLDKELNQIVRNAKIGKRFADKLFKVWRKNGKEAWLLIHIEVQGRREKRFSERMFTYWNRIRELYKHRVVSLAVLCDENPGWRPEEYRYNEPGCWVGFHFLMAKLLDYRGHEANLETDANPFAAIVLAQLKALRYATIARGTKDLEIEPDQEPLPARAGGRGGLATVSFDRLDDDIASGPAKRIS